MTVHYLIAGTAVCGEGMPTTWPPKDRWVGPLNGKLNEVTCLACKQELAKRSKDQHIKDRQIAADGGW